MVIMTRRNNRPTYGSTWVWGIEGTGGAFAETKIFSLAATGFGNFVMHTSASQTQTVSSSSSIQTYSPCTTSAISSVVDPSNCNLIRETISAGSTYALSSVSTHLPLPNIPSQAGSSLSVQVQDISASSTINRPRDIVVQQTPHPSTTSVSGFVVDPPCAITPQTTSTTQTNIPSPASTQRSHPNVTSQAGHSTKSSLPAQCLQGIPVPTSSHPRAQPNVSSDTANFQG